MRQTATQLGLLQVSVTVQEWETSLTLYVLPLRHEEPLRLKTSFPPRTRTTKLRRL